MTIKFENGNINAYATKTFIKRAQTFGTPEFYEWRAACKEFGKEVKLVAKTRSTKAQNEEKNMTYKNMVSYLSTREDKDALLEEFEEKELYEYIMRQLNQWKDDLELNHSVYNVYD